VELIRELSPVAREQRVLITHGTRDPLVPLEATRDQINQLKAAGVSIAWQEFDKAHTIAMPGELDLIRQFVVRCFA
jgi:predicted esterase